MFKLITVVFFFFYLLLGRFYVLFFMSSQTSAWLTEMTSVAEDLGQNLSEPFALKSLLLHHRQLGTIGTGGFNRRLHARSVQTEGCNYIWFSFSQKMCFANKKKGAKIVDFKTKHISIDKGTKNKSQNKQGLKQRGKEQLETSVLV